MALGLEARTWLADPVLAFVAIVVADIWQWTPFVFIMMIAALAGMVAVLLASLGVFVMRSDTVLGWVIVVAGAVAAAAGAVLIWVRSRRKT